MSVETSPADAGGIPDFESDFFQTIHKIVFTIVNKALTGKLNEYSDVAYTLGKYGVTIYVLWFAFTTLLKKQQTPVPDFIWNMCKFYIILLIVRNSGGILTSATDAIDGLKQTFSGGDPWMWMDQLWVKIIQVSKALWNRDTSMVPVEGGIAVFLTYAGGIIATFLCSIVFASAELTLLLLAITAPLFIMCLMFGFLRQMFNSWLQLNFSSVLVFLFSSLGLRAGVWLLNVILSTNLKTAPDQDILVSGATSLVAGLFMAWIIWQAKSYASQIAGVGVEGAMQGAAAMGIATGVFGASRMARGALGMGRNAGIGAWKGLRRQEGGFGQSPGITGKTANLAGQGVNIGAKKLRQAAIERAKKMYGG
ncbi:type IV secretion system protein [Salmonella enterica]|nr:type IV secretion system protein [Salmonella enterica]EEH7186446.1 type IV secretion system protein [Salmonella enterica subsp. enterica]EBQ4602775.1 type IV secretion system protein [Salmonella enterica]EFV4653817.1 type IV secretion system protein [Salmonella enterica]EJB3380277.1 type IV secretion system protein [Salmonella enterica]